MSHGRASPYLFRGVKTIDRLAQCWNPASSVERPFVRHGDLDLSPALFCRCTFHDGPVRLTVVVPTSDGDRDGRFQCLLAQAGAQDFSGYELVVVRGDHRQGRAINTAAALARGKYLLTLDDDTSLPDTGTFRKLVEVMDNHPSIGIAGGNNVIPSWAPSFLRRVMEQVPRRSWQPVQDIVDSDLAEHPCMIMDLATFRSVGGENELIPRGLDPYLREEFRRSGKRVVVVPGVIYHHLPPENLRKLLRQFYRNGRQAAYANRKYPQWIIETPDAHGAFRPRTGFPLRLARFPLRLVRALVTGKPLWFLCECAYAVGFARERVLPEES